MSARPSELHKYLLGSVLIVSMLIGGGAGRGLYTDAIIIIVCLIASGIVLASKSERLSFGQLVLPALIMLLCLIQILPLPSAALAPLRPDFLASDEGMAFVSLGVGQSLESLLIVAAPLAFFLSVLCMRQDQLRALLPFFFLGLLCNLLVATLQYSLSSKAVVSDLLPFGIQGGVFANVNHFSTLLFISIPLVIYFGLHMRQMLLGGIGLVAILLILLAVGSRAGVLIGLAITVISLVMLPRRSRVTLAAFVAIFVGLAIYGVGALSKIEAEELDPDFGRIEFSRTTLDGIRENWPLGVGFGNFVNAYQIYEKPEMIFRNYVNHAHNDYLELVFEGGILAALLIAAYLVLLIGAAFSRESSTLQRAALISILFVLVHSLVDYPMRTMAITMSFAFLNGIVFHRSSRMAAKTGDKMIQVYHDGDRFLVPVSGQSSEWRG